MAKNFCPKKRRHCASAASAKPLGPPASPGNCAAYDIFTAILDEQPYPIKAFLAFGCNPVMSNADSRRAREALSKLEFGVAIDLFMTPTAAALRLCFAGHQLSRNVQHHHRLRTSASRQDSSAISRRRGGTAARAALGYLDTFRVGKAHGHEPSSFSTATSKPAMPTSSNRRESRWNS